MSRTLLQKCLTRMYGHFWADDLCAEIRTALAQPQAAPIDYYYEWDTSDNCLHRSFSPAAWNGRKPDRSVPLYATPQAPLDGFGGNLDAAFDAAPAVQPLTDAEIERLREDTFSVNNPYCPVDNKSMRKAVRAAERAHGIAAPGSADHD